MSASCAPVWARFSFSCILFGPVVGLPQSTWEGKSRLLSCSGQGAGRPKRSADEPERLKRDTQATKLREAARLRLQQLFGCALTINAADVPDAVRSSIDLVINGSHKTFRYMLLTGLLAAVTDKSLHPRCLQINAGIPGAFDARSLCQKVIVPFEKTFLQGRLGASNEPFANKSARFAMIERTNNVRKGSDAVLLNALYDALEMVRDGSDEMRRTSFCYALALVLRRAPHEASVIELEPVTSSMLDSDAFFDFFEAHTKGVSAVATISAFFRMFYGKGTKVIVHPATESGSSSKEVGDIDLIFSDGRKYAVEVKDKPYGEVDVNHACEKAIAAGVRKVVFAIGASAMRSNVHQGALTDFWAEKGLELTFLRIEGSLAVAMAITDGAGRREMANSIYQSLVEMNAPDEVMELFRRTFKDKAA